MKINEETLKMILDKLSEQQTQINFLASQIALILGQKQ